MPALLNAHFPPSPPVGCCPARTASGPLRPGSRRGAAIAAPAPPRPPRRKVGAPQGRSVDCHRHHRSLSALAVFAVAILRHTFVQPPRPARSTPGLIGAHFLPIRGGSRSNFPTNQDRNRRVRLTHRYWPEIWKAIRKWRSDASEENVKTGAMTPRLTGRSLRDRYLMKRASMTSLYSQNYGHICRVGLRGNFFLITIQGCRHQTASRSG